MILCDSDVLIDVIRKYPPAVAWVSKVDFSEVVIPGFVAMELVRGCGSKLALERLRILLRPIRLAWPTHSECELALQTQFELHLSHGINLIDALVAHTAIGLDVPLHTFNKKHFDAVPALRTVQPYAR